MAVFYSALIGWLCYCQMVLGQQEDILKPILTTATPEPTVSVPRDSCLQLSCGPLKPQSCVEVKGPESRTIVVTQLGYELMCDTTTDNGGWTVIQRRFNGTEDFSRGWGPYKYGFGFLKGEFWLGLELIHKMTIKQCHELRIDMKYNNKDYFAKYSYFKLSGEEEKYKLELGTFSGNVGDNLEAHRGKPFSTKDSDNDDIQDSCARMYGGGWWYAGCHKSNLNGLWDNNQYAKGLTWQSVTGYYDSVTFSEMKIRPCF